MTSLSILAWNCHSLYSKLSFFKVKLYALKPHIVCLCETWLKDNFLPSFINYTPFFISRSNRPGGGLAILVRNDVCVQKKDLSLFPAGQLEIQAITVYSQNFLLDICHLYNPCVTVSSSEFNHYISQMYRNCAILGDFNAKHTLWDTTSPCNATGNNLVHSLMQFPNICLLTPVNLPTYFHLPTRSTSTLDLCFVSNHLLSRCDLRLCEDFGSDHLPTLITLAMHVDCVGLVTRRRWLCSGGTVWREWVAALPPLPHFTNIVSAYDTFLTSLDHANETTFKLSKSTLKVKYSKPWWTSACRDAIKSRHHAKNVFKKHPTLSNLHIFRQAETHAKRIIRDAKAVSFREFCSSINSHTPVKTVWQNINKLAHKYKPARHIPFLTNNAIVTNPQDKANAIADVFESLSNSNCTKDARPYLPSIDRAVLNCSNCDLNRDLTIHELENCLRTLKNTSPGEDRIQNVMLKHLPSPYVQFLLDMLNDSFSTAHIPGSWRCSIILPFLKPHKPETDPKSYRPISLLSCIGKVMERLLHSRLMYYLETNIKLSATQSGFRKRLCTLDQLSRLEHHIRCSLRNKYVCLCVFIDFSSAFDCVWHIGLLYKLASMGVTGRLLNWIRAYLVGRSFRVFYQGMYSTDRPAKSGVPQGSVLSPLLFNVLTSDLPIVEGVHLAEYADDILFYCSAPSLADAQSLIQNQLNELSTWTDRWGMSINANKTKGMIFHSGPGVSPLLNLLGSHVHFVDVYKYLGMWLDSPKLTWKPHIHRTKTACIPRLNVMKSISSHHWGSDRRLLLTIYVTYIRSLLDYGSMFYSVAPQYSLSALDTVQNQCLRIALGVRQTSPIVSLEIESNIPPLDISRCFTMLKYYNRLSQLPSHLAISKELFPTNTPFFQVRWPKNFIPPLIVRCATAYRKLNLVKPPYRDSPLLLPCPPWVNPANIFNSDFPLPSPKSAPISQIYRAFLRVQLNQYPNFTEIYTDGSHVNNPSPSSTAAIAISTGSQFLTRSWRLRGTCSIFVAELFAILQALKYISQHCTNTNGIVIYTDSLSSVLALQNRFCNSHIPLLYAIHDYIHNILQTYTIKLQYVPSHSQIAGNEMADGAAKGAHAAGLVSLFTPVLNEDLQRELKSVLWDRWTTRYHTYVMATGKAINFFTCKGHAAYWPWSHHSSRIIETALAKLRTGHVGLKAHLFRIQKSDSALCGCGQPETVDHFLLHCPLYSAYRFTLTRELTQLGIPLTRKNLLGGGPFERAVQFHIQTLVASYLSLSGKLTTL